MSGGAGGVCVDVKILEIFSMQPSKNAAQKKAALLKKILCGHIKLRKVNFRLCVFYVTV